MATGEIHVEVLHQPHHTGGAGARPVGGHGYEVDLHGQVGGPGEIGKEHVGTSQHADQQRSLAGIVGAELAAQLGDAFAELGFGEHDRTDVGVGLQVGLHGGIGHES